LYFVGPLGREPPPVLVFCGALEPLPPGFCEDVWNFGLDMDYLRSWVESMRRFVLRLKNEVKGLAFRLASK